MAGPVLSAGTKTYLLHQHQAHPQLSSSSTHNSTVDYPPLSHHHHHHPSQPPPIPSASARPYHPPPPSHHHHHHHHPHHPSPPPPHSTPHTPLKPTLPGIASILAFAGQDHHPFTHPRPSAQTRSSRTQSSDPTAHALPIGSSGEHQAHHSQRLSISIDRQRTSPDHAPANRRRRSSSMTVVNLDLRNESDPSAQTPLPLRSSPDHSLGSPPGLPTIHSIQAPSQALPQRHHKYPESLPLGLGPADLVDHPHVRHPPHFSRLPTSDESLQRRHSDRAGSRRSRPQHLASSSTGRPSDPTSYACPSSAGPTYDPAYDQPKASSSSHSHSFQTSDMSHYPYPSPDTWRPADPSSETPGAQTMPSTSKPNKDPHRKHARRLSSGSASSSSSASASASLSSDFGNSLSLGSRAAHLAGGQATANTSLSTSVNSSSFYPQPRPSVCVSELDYRLTGSGGMGQKDGCGSVGLEEPLLPPRPTRTPSRYRAEDESQPTGTHHLLHHPPPPHRSQLEVEETQGRGGDPRRSSCEFGRHGRSSLSSLHAPSTQPPLRRSHPAPAPPTLDYLTAPTKAFAPHHGTSLTPQQSSPDQSPQAHSDHSRHRPIIVTSPALLASSSATANRYQCSEIGCGKTFSRPSSLKIHTYSHTGQKPFKCLRCDRAFSVQSNLKRHQKVHERRSGRGEGGSRMKDSLGGLGSDQMIPTTPLRRSAPASDSENDEVEESDVDRMDED